ncbi:cyclin-dependent kinase 11B [Pundamilia nyererei]|uniref:Cyclin-dependent kinase 11B n=1 Tax=Pundamilia nyererei TaxID=303518 RepID=A0A9Y6M8V5_9CICH|nr:PREDICTED: cyclin-dependent kinase 11B-like [Pundamilia nyererei]
MGDEKDTWKVKTLDEILLEKKRRKELQEKTDPKRQKNFSKGLASQADDREAKRDTPEEGELRDQRMEITIRNSPYARQDSMEDRGEEDESLAIKPPQQIARKDKSHHRKEEKRKDKRRHRSHSAEGAGKHARLKDKEKERESDRRKRHWEEDKARRDWERQKRREQARAHSRRERDRLEQLERQRERDRKLWEQQKEQRELKDRERRAEERRKERGTRREVPSRMLPEEYDDKPKQSHRSRSPVRVPRERSDHSETRKSGSSKEEKPESKDLLADLQDISDNERKTSTAESSLASASVSEEEEDEEEDEEESSSQSEGEEEEEEESASGSGRSEQSAEDVSEDEQSGEDFEQERENGNHIPAARTLTLQTVPLRNNRTTIRIGDFGLAREYGSPLKPYTPVVVTLWYRSPELLLGAKEYSTAVDMWSVGCIFGELLTQKPLFPGKSEIDQINKIFKDLGSPSEKIWPGYSELPAVKKMTFTEYPYNNLRKRFGALLSDQGFDLMNKFLTYCPSKRISSDEALKHEYFRESPLPIDSSMFPTWPAKSEQQRVKRGTSPRPPEGGLGYSHLGDDDLRDTGFHLTTSYQGASAVGPGFSLKF